MGMACQRILHQMSRQIWLWSPRKMAYPMRMACQRILHRMSHQIWLRSPTKMAYPMRMACQRIRSPDEPSDLAAVSHEDGISHEDGMSKDSLDPSDLAAGLAEAAIAKEITIKAIIFTL